MHCIRHRRDHPTPPLPSRSKGEHVRWTREQRRRGDRGRGRDRDRDRDRDISTSCVLCLLHYSHLAILKQQTSYFLL